MASSKRLNCVPCLRKCTWWCSTSGGCTPSEGRESANGATARQPPVCCWTSSKPNLLRLFSLKAKSDRPLERLALHAGRGARARQRACWVIWVTRECDSPEQVLAETKRTSLSAKLQVLLQRGGGACGPRAEEANLGTCAAPAFQLGRSAIAPTLSDAASPALSWTGKVWRWGEGYEHLGISNYNACLKKAVEKNYKYQRSC